MRDSVTGSPWLFWSCVGIPGWGLGFGAQCWARSLVLVGQRGLAGAGEGGMLRSMLHAWSWHLPCPEGAGDAKGHAGQG